MANMRTQSKYTQIYVHVYVTVGRDSAKESVFFIITRLGGHYQKRQILRHPGHYSSVMSAASGYGTNL